MIDVNEINERNLERMIGHRYVHDEGEKPGLHRLVQACIDFFKTQSEEFSKNAFITIYDEDNMYKIASGTKKHQFICRMINGKPYIKDNMSDTDQLKSKPYHKPSTQTPHDLLKKVCSFISDCHKKTQTLEY